MFVQSAVQRIELIYVPSEAAARFELHDLDGKL